MNIGLGIRVTKLQPQTATLTSLSPLPSLPGGYGFLIDGLGNYLVDLNGNYLIGLF